MIIGHVSSCLGVFIYITSNEEHDIDGQYNTSNS